MAGLEVQVLTPFGITYSEKIESCVVPGLMGQFQVLKDHAAMLAAVGIGIINIENEKGEKKLLATSGGYCEVETNKVKIIVESAETTEKIDIERAKQAKDRAEKRLQSEEPDIDVERAKLALARALNRLRLYELMK